MTNLQWRLLVCIARMLLRQKPTPDTANDLGRLAYLVEEVQKEGRLTE